MLANTISPNFFLQVFATLTIVIFSAFSAVKTEVLYFASYNNKWYNCNKKMMTKLEIFSLCTREAFEIRGCCVVKMNLQTYKEAVTDSYSNLMVLMTMDNYS